MNLFRSYNHRRGRRGRTFTIHRNDFRYFRGLVILFSHTTHLGCFARGRDLELKDRGWVPILPAIVMRWTAIFVAMCFAAGWVSGSEGVPFGVGEMLTYKIYWGPFVAGQATLEVRGIETVDGHECYHLVASARTSGLAEMLFPVRSRTESWLDRDELCTRRFVEDRHEGRYVDRSTIHYDYQRGQSTMTNLINGTETVLPISGPSQDILSSLYYARTRPLQLDQIQTFFVNTGNTNRLVRLQPDQRKTVKMNLLGEVAALRVEPSPTLRVVAENKGRMWFWVSDDARRIPLQLITSMKIGSARFYLAEMKTAASAPVKLAARN